MDNDRYQKAVFNIINIQKQIIGPLALEMARKVANINVGKNGEVEIVGNPLTVLHQLVKEYEVLFGELSVKISRDSIKEMKFEPTELPEILR
jgi:hypothetical protein